VSGESLPELLIQLSVLLPDMVFINQIRPPWVNTARSLDTAPRIFLGHKYARPTETWRCLNDSKAYPEWKMHGNAEAAVQIAVQAYCAEKGWPINLELRDRSIPNNQVAVIYTPKFHSGHGDTPACALVKALLQILEAVIASLPT
jgi:hypothetical protein